MFGGGMILEFQGVMLDMLGVCGFYLINFGDNVCCFVRIIVVVVFVGELLLCSVLVVGYLVKVYM